MRDQLVNNFRLGVTFLDYNVGEFVINSKCKPVVVRLVFLRVRFHSVWGKNKRKEGGGFACRVFSFLPPV